MTEDVEPDIADEGWVTRAEASRQAGIDKSSVTRYLEQHPDLTRDDGRVNLAEFLRHRRVNLKSRSIEDARAREKEATASLREIELRKARGELKEAAQIESLVVAALDDLFLRVRNELDRSLRSAGVDEPGGAVIAVTELIDAERSRLADRMQEVGRRDDAGLDSR